MNFTKEVLNTYKYEVAFFYDFVFSQNIRVTI